MYSRLKTCYVATKSVENFLWRHPATYYWTFTVAECLTDKHVAMARAKPFFDLIGRSKGLAYLPVPGGTWSFQKTRGTYLAFWELQKRGAWHLHLLTNCFFDVNFLRPWMVKRGWGPQMRVELVKQNHSVSETTGQPYRTDASRLARYLTKYLTKSMGDDCRGKKPFSCSDAARAGTIGFQWTPDINPTAYLYYWGRVLYIQLYHRAPKFFEFRFVCRLGYESCDWRDVDPWMDPPG